MSKTRRAVAAAAVLLALSSAGISTAKAAPLADADVVVMGGSFGAFTPPLFGLGPSSGQYTVGGNCTLVAAGVSVPTFIDVPPDEGLTGGTCHGVSGSGTFNSLSCGTGTASGSMSIIEPAGDRAALDYSIVFVAGIGALTGTWADDGGSGPAVGVVLIVPSNPADCLGVVSQYNFTAVVAAEY